MKKDSALFAVFLYGRIQNEDVKPGDRYSLTYIAGIGTELALNGKPKGTIEGLELAAALFSIRLGNKPINKSFKKQILGLQ